MQGSLERCLPLALCKNTKHRAFFMPLHQSITPAPQVRAHIWHVTETEADLARGIELRLPCQERLNGMKSGIHRRGFLSIRHLLAIEGYTDQDLYYDSQGKPHLQDGTNISITHSFEFAGVIFSGKQEVGIDIEKQRDKILRIAHKFTPLNEYRSLANDEALIRKLTMVWTAKESIYKVMSQPGLSFLENIRIADFSMDDPQSTGKATFGANTRGFTTRFLEFDGYTCGYALAE